MLIFVFFYYVYNLAIEVAKTKTTALLDKFDPDIAHIYMLSLLLCVYVFFMHTMATSIQNQADPGQKITIPIAWYNM